MGYNPKYNGYSGLFEGIKGYSCCSGPTGFTGHSGHPGMSGYSGISWEHFDKTFDGKSAKKLEIKREVKQEFKLPEIPKKVWLFLIPIIMCLGILTLLCILEKIAIK